MSPTPPPFLSLDTVVTLCLLVFPTLAAVAVFLRMAWKWIR